MGAHPLRCDVVLGAEILLVSLSSAGTGFSSSWEGARRDTMRGAKHIVEMFYTWWRVVARWCFMVLRWSSPTLRGGCA